MKNRFFRKHFLTWQVLPLVVVAVVLKWVVQDQGWDAMPMNPLVSTVVAANVFLLGFLISGLLPDYKEAEKIPGEMSASLDTLVDENLIVWKNKQAPVAKAFLEHLGRFARTLDAWFHKTARTREVMKALRDMNAYFAELEQFTQANFITRMKQDQNAIRKMVIRVHTIRETTFIATAYAIAESFTFLVLLTLLFVEIGPLGESLFFMGLITFVLTYMIGLIKDLDNPFHYHQNRHLDDEIAVEPIRIVAEKIEGELKVISS